MKPENNHKDNESAMDKIADKAKEVFGDDGDSKKKENEETKIDTPFQDTPDSGFGDVPQEDKIIRDPETGEETYIRNDNKR